MTVGGYGPFGTPGSNASRESQEADVLFGNPEYNQAIFKSVIIDSTAVSTLTPTSILPPGLVLAELASGAGWVDYDADATDGSQFAKGVLVEEVNLHDPATASVADRHCRVMIAGPVKAGSLSGLDYQARAQLKAGGFIFDDDRWSGHGRDFSHVVPKAADYTVVAADNGTLFQATTGAVTFTLPTIAAGLSFMFMQTTDNNMVVSSAGSSDNIIGMHDLGADTATFSTASEKIGACLKVTAIYVGADLKWLAQNLSAGANTVTYA